MEISMLIMLVSFLVLLALNVPIAFGLSIATLLTMLFTIDFTPAVVTMAQRMAGGINSFALLAIPFFVFSGLRSEERRVGKECMSGGLATHERQVMRTLVRDW